jgi:hypothetical protein
MMVCTKANRPPADNELEANMAKRLTRDELVQTVRVVLDPRGFSSEEVNQKLLLFAINCPDPAAAINLVIETPPPTTAEELVTRALACPPRDVRTLPPSELHPDDPLRFMELDS